MTFNQIVWLGVVVICVAFWSVVGTLIAGQHRRLTYLVAHRSGSNFNLHSINPRFGAPPGA